MGWNTSALFVPGSSTAAAVALLSSAARPDPGVLVGADDATSGLASGVLFAASSGGWTQVWDPSMELAPGCSPPGTALTVVFSSVASSYGFTLFAEGEVARSVVYADAAPVVSTGMPLPVEATVDVPSWGPDEDFVWAVISAVTGTGYQDSLQFETWRR